MNGPERDSGDPLVELARTAIETYVRSHKVLIPREPVGSGPERAGVFVSLHRGDGSLRGCIGTIQPTRDSLEEEIVGNAISAATADPRFYPLTADEIDGLEISVDVLGQPEPVEGLEDLDPSEYGVIVQGADGRQGLLLPDLEGVETAEQQVDISCRKGGIDPRRDRYRLFRFRVERHH